MSWPMSHEFNEAIQNANVVFSDADLRTGEAVVGARGLPLPRSGNFADVYQVRGADGRDWAVKCFTRPVTGLGDRYAVISEALAQAALPFTVDFTYLAEGIRIGDKWWPVVKMEWVEGLLLNQVVREHAGKPAVLGVLGVLWARLCKRLRESRVAHADLQHGNVLLVPGSRPGAYGLKLIDYDGMYVPALANHPSGESGHPAYQHPARTSKGGYSPDVDRFPELLIAAALKGLEAGGMALWERYDTGDNLLFTEEDIQSPANSKLMRELWNTNHPGVQALVGRLAIAAQKPMPQTPWLDQVNPEGEPAPLDEPTRRDALQALGLSAPVAVAPPLVAPAAAPAPAVWEAIVGEPPALATPAATRSGTVRSTIPAGRPVAAPSKRPARTVTDEQEAEDETPRSSSGRILAIAGALVVLIGGSVAGVALFGGKPKQQTVENDTEKSGAAETSGATTPKDKDASLKGSGKKTSGGAKEPGKGNETASPASVSVPGTEASGPVEISIKELKRIQLGKELPSSARFNGDGGRLVVLSLPQFLRSYSPTSGAYRPLPLDAGQGAPHYVVNGHEVVAWYPGESQCVVLDLNANRAVGKLQFPELPLQEGKSQDAIFAVSPNLRYIAAGRKSYFKGDETDRQFVQGAFRLLDAETGNVLQAFDWSAGTIHFSADSSRVLVFEHYGRGRWFKLPSGQPDGEWRQGNQAIMNNVLTVEGASADGQRLLCFGTAENQQRSHFILDGVTGRVFAMLGQGFLRGSGGLSADGRIAALLRKPGPTDDLNLIVFDAVRGVEINRVKVPDNGLQQPLLTLAPNGRRAAILFRQHNGIALVYDLEAGAPSGEVAVKPKEPGGGVKEEINPADLEFLKPKDPPMLKPLVELKRRWTAPAALAAASRIYAADPETNLLVLGSAEGALALEQKTGAPRKEKDFVALASAKTHELFPLEHERFATLSSKRDDFVIWDARTGGLIERITAPSLPAGPAAAANLYTALSRNKKFVAVGRIGAPAADQPSVPFKIVDAGLRKPIVTTEWHGGTVHFTADCSRVLVAEWNGRGRWFKLPSGDKEEESGWDFGPPQGRRISAVLAISGDGALVAYSGPPAARAEGGMLGVLDGKTGRVLRSLPAEYHDSSPIAMTENGRRIAVLRAFQAGDAREIDVINVSTGLVYHRARLDPGKAIPTFDFTPDGKSLVVHDETLHQVALFDLPGA